MKTARKLRAKRAIKYVPRSQWFDPTYKRDVQDKPCLIPAPGQTISAFDDDNEVSIEERQQQTGINAHFPPKFKFLFRPKRYKVAHGGRGSAKSWNFARALIIMAYEKKIRVLCGREFQNSIKESVHHLLESQIERLGLSAYFKITDAGITSHLGSEFIFTGLKNNTTKIKSLEGVNIAWIEEAEKVSDRSWEILIPTMREKGSEIWISFNPDSEKDPTFVRFVTNEKMLGDDCHTVQVSWRDNPWFPEELRKEKDYLARVDPIAYAHVWEGACRTNSDKQVLFGKYVIQHFEVDPTWDGPYQGADWGFAKDPTTLVRCYIDSSDKEAPKLYISHEAYGIGVDTNNIPAMFNRRVPDGAKYRTRGDCARPETISYLQKHGYPEIVGCIKWDGSVEDGVAFLRQFAQIIIHNECTHTAEEARLYSYKVDKLTGDILPEIEDKHNHIWDAVRYALEPHIRNAGTGLFAYMQRKLKDKADNAKRDDVGTTTELGAGSEVRTVTQQGQPPIPTSWIQQVVNGMKKP